MLNGFKLNPHLLAKPSYAPGKMIEELQEEYGLETILDLASNVNPFGPSPLAVEAVKRATRYMQKYPNLALDQLRFELAESLGPGYDEDNIVIGNGSCDILRMVAEVFLYGGGASVIRRNAFPMFEVVTKMYGGECVFADTNKDYTFDILSLVEKITDRTRLVFLANPHNPTGMIITQQQLDEFLERVPPSVLVVLDHACEEYVEASEYPDAAKHVMDGRNVIITRTFSKMYALPGLRMGYGIAKKSIIDLLRRTKTPFHSNTVSLMGAKSALQDVAHVESSRRANTKGKEYLFQKFEELGLSYVPSESSFILLVDFEWDTRVICRALLRRGIAVLPAHPYNWPQAIRVTVGKPEQNARLVEALELALEESVSGSER